MTKFSKKRIRLDRHLMSIYLLIASLEGMVATFFLFKIPSEAGQSFILGLSPQRFVLVFGNIVIAFFLLSLAIYFWKYPHFEEELKLRLSQRKMAAILFIASTMTGIVFISLAFLIPEYRFSSFAGYIERLRPTILWFSLISVQTIFFFFFIVKPKFEIKRYKGAVLAFFSLFVFLWIFIAWSGFGINPDDRYWNEAGVPLLNDQVFFAIIISIVFFFLSSIIFKNIQSKSLFAFIHEKQDALIFIFLWIIAAFLWINEPLPRNFFAPGPYFPNHELSPYADSATYDIGGQFSLIGQGLFNARFYARALLSGFLALLHIIVGQNYLSVVALQTAIFASFVPILYLIGKELHSRIAGILISILIIFKGINAIASSTWILSVHPKYMLTEFATGIMLALFTLWFIRWQKKGAEKESFLILSGGALGLGIMLRTNILFFIFLASLLFFLKFKLNWREILRATLVLVLAFFITISPWMWRSQKAANTPFFFLDILGGVIRARYSLEPAENISPYLQAQEINLTGLMPERSRTKLPEASLEIEKLSTYQLYNSLVFIPNHFFHNIVTSVLILPPTLVFHDLQHTIKEIYPYWNKIDGHWVGGQLTIGAKIGLLWNLFLLALGLSAVWKRWRVAGLLPLFVFLTYHLSNGFARTSGGRYLVPVDWVILFYYALGIIEILFFIATSLGIDIRSSSTEKNTRNESALFLYQRGVLYVLPFFLFVVTITMLDQAIPPRYSELRSGQISEEILQGNFLEEKGISDEEFKIFLQDPNSRVFLGRSLYPRFYLSGEGEHSKGKDAFEDKDFSRITFTMIGQFGQTGVILPLDNVPVHFPNAADIILIGCQHSFKGYLSSYVDAYMVILLDENQEIVYMREPETAFQCPLPEPICDDNHNCR